VIADYFSREPSRRGRRRKCTWAFSRHVVYRSVAVLQTAASAQERVVNVYNWSDYIDPKVLEEFTKETGIKVRYDTFDSNEIVEAKLLAGKTGYDVVVPGSTVLRRLISVGIFQKLDKSKIPNLSHAWPEITQRLAAYDPGNEYAVNYMWGTTGIGYNAAKVKERLGDIPVDSWDIFFKPENLAKLRSCGVHVLDTAEELLPAALKYLGLDPDSKTAADIEKAGELLLKLRPNIQKFHSSEYLNALANGEICLVIGWSGDVFQAKNRAKEAAEKTRKPVVEIEYVVPKEGAQIWFDSFSIPERCAEYGSGVRLHQLHDAPGHRRAEYELRRLRQRQSRRAEIHRQGNPRQSRDLSAWRRLQAPLYRNAVSRRSCSGP
jgi:putrescine transport system substrate-binding protein